MHLNTITKLLDIPNYRAVEVTDRGEYENIYIVLEREEDTPPVCSKCGKSAHSRDAMIVEEWHKYVTNVVDVINGKSSGTTRAAAK